MNITQHIGFWLSLIPAVFFFGYIVERYATAWCRRPKIAREEIVYQEWFASGASQKNILTELGGARNCLRLVVTRDLLWITSWFPFSMIAAVYDLVHVIPLRSISSVQPVRRFRAESLLLAYTDDLGRSHCLRLTPKDRERFVEALKLGPDRSNGKRVA